MLPGKGLTIVMGLLASAAALAACFRAGDGGKSIDTARLHAMVVHDAERLEAGRKRTFTVVDARTEEEYDAAHVFTAINVPVKDFERSAHVLPENKNTFIAVYDDGINSGTGKLWAGKAAAAGYTNVAVYSDGFPAWKASHMPVAPLTGP